MLFSTTYEQFEALAKESQRVVVSQEIYADILTPVRVFQSLSQGVEQAVLLDSSDHPTAQDACIYIGLDPIAEFNADKNGFTTTSEGKKQQVEGDAFELLRKFYNDHKSAFQHSLAKFAGGMIGFIGYDAVRFIEDIPDRHNNDEFPLMNFKCYGTNIAFDKRTGKALVTHVVKVADDLRACYEAAVAANETIIQRMLDGAISVQYTKSSEQEVDPFENISLDSSDEEFKSMVEQAKDHIKKGDAFQIVVSRRFQAPFKGNDFDFYRALRVLNPSPYQFYIRDKGYTVVGSSPEKLVSVQNNIIESTPIAGTRRRGKTYEEDQAIAADLLSDEKEIAEHMMLIDLARNDVGSVSEVGTVEVVEQKKIKMFSSVMHISSTVQGVLDSRYDAFDVMKHSFPAGTLSGAPKVRAMQIIDEIESSSRGLYGGAIMSVDNQGQMDSCIVIRTIVLKDAIATVRAGAGIVYDSDPQSEADETRHKATGVLRALKLAERGLV
jgi:anthranilate synthase component 1